MAVIIRLTRIGRTNLPFYRIGVYDERTRRNGQALEFIGWYNPLIAKDSTTQKGLEMDEERVKYWLSKGAKVSETIASFLAARKMKYRDAAAHREKNRKHSEGRLAAIKKIGGFKNRPKARRAAKRAAAKKA